MIPIQIDNYIKEVIKSVIDDFDLPDRKPSSKTDSENEFTYRIRVKTMSVSFELSGRTNYEYKTIGIVNGVVFLNVNVLNNSELNTSTLNKMNDLVNKIKAIL